MRTVFGTIAGLASKAFTFTVVVCYIADDILSTAGNHISWWWDGVTGKRRELTEDEKREIEEQAAAELEATKDLPPRPGIQHPRVS